MMLPPPTWTLHSRENLWMGPGRSSRSLGSPETTCGGFRGSRVPVRMAEAGSREEEARSRRGSRSSATAMALTVPL